MSGQLKLKINEAMALHTARTGERLEKKKLAALLFADAPTDSARQVAMTNICRGRTLRIKPEWIPIICNYCGCSADFLFGMENV